VSQPPATPGLRARVEQARTDRSPLVVPGAYDALSARLIAGLGFPAVYVTGAGLANARFGVPDIGLHGLAELCDQVEAIAEVVDVPLIVDADTGFGNAVTLTRTVRRLERAGAAALQIEDQVWPKKCGHFAGKEVVSVPEMVSKVRAAVDSRSSEETLIIARTDARAIEGMAAALDRAEAYREAGADVLFVEAPSSEEELEAVGRRFDVPLVANMVEGGVTPIVEAERLGAWGFTIILYANAALRAAQRNVTLVLDRLRREGSTLGVGDLISTWQERQEAVGKSTFDELEERYKW
jgi:2-methylisocitrate lyase-like PEP mutase family enzyme